MQSLIDDLTEEQEDENAIRLPYKFHPREYQRPMFQALVPELFPPIPTELDEVLGTEPSIPQRVKNAVIIYHRRAGKDKCAINILMCRAMIEVGNYLYMAPQASQARKIVWQGVGSDGLKFIDHIPPELIKTKRDQEMWIELINGSTIQVAGSDNYDTLVGTNPIGIVFSEYSLQNPAALQYFRPMLVENGGWALFIFTFRGRNHGYDIYRIAKERQEQQNPAWFCQLATIDDTTRPDGSPVVTRAQYEQEIEDGMPEATALQEYYCDPNQGSVGSYYADIMTKLREEKQIGHYPHDPAMPVVTSWDLGLNDQTAIWFIQMINGSPRIIDYIAESNVPLTEWVRRVKNKKYNYYAHIGPHDLKHREYSSGITRLGQAAKLDFHFDVAPKMPINDSIAAVRALLPRCQFHELTCEEGIESLSYYRRKYDDVLQNFADKPLHDKYSHGADAFKYFAVMAEQYEDIDKPMKKFKVIGAL